MSTRKPLRAGYHDETVRYLMKKMGITGEEAEGRLIKAIAESKVTMHVQLDDGNVIEATGEQALRFAGYEDAEQSGTI